MRMTAAVMYEQGLLTPFAESKPYRIEEVELDPPGPGEVLVEVRGAGLCHQSGRTSLRAGRVAGTASKLSQLSSMLRSEFRSLPQRG